MGRTGTPTPRLPGGGARLSRRSLLRTAGALGLLGGAGTLSGCSAMQSGSMRFLMAKPEVIGHFGQLTDAYNSERGGNVYHDSTSWASLSAQFVRGAPPDLACYDYRFQSANYVRRGMLLDLSDQPAAAAINPASQDLVEVLVDPDRRYDVLPYSTAAAGVIYNLELFDEHGVEVPQTWDEFVTACETFQDAGVQPIYGTFRDGWTLNQHYFDYFAGGSVDVGEFFGEVRAAGPDFEPGADYSFSGRLAQAAERMVSLRPFINQDAGARTYPDGTLAYGQGGAAMYLQGPWALSELAKVDADLPVGMFALPVLDEPGTAQCRVNVDLGLWVPLSSPHRQEALDFMDYLFTPDLINAYNLDNLYFSPLADAPPQTDERVAGLQPLIDEGRFYQGPSTFMPDTIPLGNYLQEAMMTGDAQAFLTQLDRDWQRHALRGA